MPAATRYTLTAMTAASFADAVEHVRSELKEEGFGVLCEIDVHATPHKAGIERMVDEDRYCADILTQIAAVSTASESLGLQILDGHAKHCVAGALASGDQTEAETKTQELLDAVRHFTADRRPRAGSR